MEELRQAYIQKLGRALDMERYIVSNLPALIEASSNEALRTGLSDHLNETRSHVVRVEEVLKGHRSSNATEKDAAFRLMVDTAAKDIAQVDDPNVRDALIIASAQAVEHIEMAKYGTLVAWAKEIDEDGEFINMLQKTLDEEKAADKKLSSAAEGGIFVTGVNQMAAK